MRKMPLIAAVAGLLAASGLPRVARKEPDWLGGHWLMLVAANASLSGRGDAPNYEVKRHVPRSA